MISHCHATASSLLRVSLKASRGNSHHAARLLLSSLAAARPNLIPGVVAPQHHVNGAALHVNPKSDLVVVLDMDECLIHSQFFSPHAAKLAHQLPNGHASSWNYSTSKKRVESFRLTLPDGDVVHVNKRPNLEEFLKHVCNRYETHVFTAAMEVYAAPVLDKLDRTGNMFAQRHYREACVFQDGNYIKDLRQLNKSLERTVLVDNNPMSFLANPSNGILVDSFYSDPEDNTLYAVQDLLEELDREEDVRPVLEERFRLGDALEDVRNEPGVAASFE
jgi:Dullard-like phosphatase family protein